MRIIGGTLKGRKTTGKYPDSVRPTTDMARETLFNILSNLIDFTDAKILDLFAGSGLLGIEAISRGADYVEFYDISYKNISQIKVNLKSLGLENAAFAQKLNFKQALKKEGEFDLIFIDPPYDRKYYQDVIDTIQGNSKLKPMGLLILEHRAGEIFNIGSLSLLKEREIGTSKFSILQNSDTHKRD